MYVQEEDMGNPGPSRNFAWSLGLYSKDKGFCQLFKEPHTLILGYSSLVESLHICASRPI